MAAVRNATGVLLLQHGQGKSWPCMSCIPTHSISNDNTRLNAIRSQPYNHSHIAIAAINTCAVAYLQLPLTASGIVQLLWTWQLFLVCDHAQFQRLPQHTAITGVCGSTCASMIGSQSSYLPRALLFLTTLGAVHIVMHTLLNGQMALDKQAAKLHSSASTAATYPAKRSNSGCRYEGCDAMSKRNQTGWLQYWLQPLQLTERQELWDAKCFSVVFQYMTAIKILVPAVCGPVAIYTSLRQATLLDW
jgi:hypothetical protein